MAAVTGDRNLQVTQLDFEYIRDSFKDYLRGQDYFKDYDFEGSALSTLLDVLAYNTHYQGFYANMVANEMFLDSAVKRNSIVSHAKHIGYTPTSYTAPTAVVQVLFPDYNDSSSGTLILPQYAQFSALGSDNKTYRFINTSQVLLDTTTTPFGCTAEIFQGTIKYKNWVVDKMNPNQRFVIPDVNVDTKHIVVRVQTSPTDTTGFDTPWTLVNNYTEIKATDEVYFLQENVDGFFELYFGDNLVGKGLTDANLITVEYMVTDGPFANGIGNAEYYASSADGMSGDTFKCDLANTTNVYVVSPTNGGSLTETEKSIKYYAPLSYQAQDRAVTTLDYQTTIQKSYPAAESISIWGGEDHDPPFYGRVFISIKPNEGLTLTSSEKENIVNSILKSKNIVTVRPVVIDPEFTYLRVTTEASYDQTKTGLSPGNLQTSIISTIKNYIDDDLEKFDTGLRFSRFVDLIDDTNTAITNNHTTIKIEKRFIPLAGQDVYILNFENSLHHPHHGHAPIVSSNGFTYKIADNPLTQIDESRTVTAYVDDDGKGILRLYYYDDDAVKVYFHECGTIEYSTGKVGFKDFYPVTSPAQEIRLIVQPDRNDINVTKNNILTMDNTDPYALIVSMSEISKGKSYTVTNTDYYVSGDNSVTDSNY